MRCAAAHLVHDHADELRAAWNVDVADRLHRTGIGVLVQHVRDVVRLIGVPDSLVIGAPLEDLLEAPVQIPHYGHALDDPFAGELQDEAEHAVRRGMLRAHVEDELLDLALFDLDRRERVIARVRRLAPRRALPPPLDVGGGYPYPPFMIFSRSRSSPSMRASGRGGQPGTYTSTGTTVSTPCSVEYESQNSPPEFAHWPMEMTHFGSGICS